MSRRHSRHTSFHCPAASPTLSLLLSFPSVHSCQPGSFTSLPGQRSCLDCLPGQSAGEPGSEACAVCGPGFYSASPASPACLPCEPGRFTADSSSSTCAPCSPGRFQPSLNASDCLPCSPGFFQESPGKSECDPCPPGEYNSKPGQTTCQKAGAGHFVEEVGSSELLFRASSSSSSSLPFSSSTSALVWNSLGVPPLNPVNQGASPQSEAHPPASCVRREAIIPCLVSMSALTVSLGNTPPRRGVWDVPCARQEPSVPGMRTSVPRLVNLVRWISSATSPGAASVISVRSEKLLLLREEPSVHPVNRDGTRETLSASGVSQGNSVMATRRRSVESVLLVSDGWIFHPKRIVFVFPCVQNKRQRCIHSSMVCLLVSVFVRFGCRSVRCGIQQHGMHGLSLRTLPGRDGRRRMRLLSSREIHESGRHRV